MAIIKCKMCGGDIELSPDKTFGTCEYCGSTMTLPKVSDDQRAALFNRGNHFRRSGEFDKALAIYENIVREDDTDAEAHWCCALCRFGIEYVEDPNTYEYLPTCHRASFDSILEDVDYLAALEHSDGITRRQYQKDAAKIAEVQRGILATSQKEEPFDVFICYKETDDATKERTRDSLDAQEIYYNLTQEGYRVFFSRITLEDKAGTEYEPYIFAALNSAKVMVAIGEKAEYFNAVWVKNEWSRFLSLMRKDRSKLLLPCYKNMDPYDLPEQLSVLQGYDMTRIGFMQDLIRGVKKVLAKNEPKETVRETVVQQVVQQSTGGANLTAQLKRGNQALEDRDWAAADGFFDKALDMDAECAEAFFGKALAKAQCVNGEEFIQKRIVRDTPKSGELTSCNLSDTQIEETINRYAIPEYYPESLIRSYFLQGQHDGAKVIISAENCKACGICVKECPVHATRVVDAGGRKMVIVGSACNNCGICVKKCPFNAVSFPTMPWTYISFTKDWGSRIAQEEEYWEKTDRNISRALRYARGDTANEYKRYKEAVMSALRSKLQESENADVQAQETLNQRYAEAMELAEQKAVAGYEAAAMRRQNDYENFCKKQTQAKTLNEYAEVVSFFERDGMRGYKDCDERVKQCRVELGRLNIQAVEEAKRIREHAASQNEERKQLEAEINRLIDALSKAKGPFSGKRKKDLEEQIMLAKSKLQKM